MLMQRGEVWYADLITGTTIHNTIKPVLIVSNQAVGPLCTYRYLCFDV